MSELILPNSLGVTDDWPVLRAEALYGLAGDIVRAATAESEADPAAVLATFLTVVGIAMGRDPRIRVSDDYHHARLFCVLVGQSARGRKGTSEAPIRRIWDIGAREVGALAWKPGPMSSGEGLVHQIRDRDDGEGEGVTDKRMVVVESEFAASLRAMGREGNTLSATLRTAWDGKTLEPLTKSKPIKASNPHIGIVAHITQPELSKLLKNVEIFNGFANRFLWWCVRRVRIVPLARGLAEIDAVRLGQALAERLRFVGKLSELDFNDEALCAYKQAYSYLSSDDRGGLHDVTTSRAEVQVIRLALIYACLDGEIQIAVPHLNAALAVWDFCDASAKRLFGGIVAHSIESQLLEALNRGPATKTNLHKALSNHGSAADLGSALGALEARGMISKSVERTGGRPREVWILMGDKAGAPN